jgi:hypothetical protein
MATPLSLKAGASMINFSLMIGASIPLYLIMPDVESWRASLIATFFIYNWIFRDRCLGMRLMDTYIERPASVPYIGAYTTGFASILYSRWFPFDLGLLYATVQGAVYVKTGNTLHGTITGSFTLTRTEYVRNAKDRALLYLEKGKLDSAVVSMAHDMMKYDHRAEADLLFMPAMQSAALGDKAGVRAYIEGFN